MRKSCFSQTESDSVSRQESQGDSNLEAQTVWGFRNIFILEYTSDKRGKADYNRRSGCLWSLRDSNP